jgi:nicotinate phosphoribosyltransferase
VDTYDTLEGARRAAAVAHELRREGRTLGGVRLDSGDLLALSRRVRALLDAAGLPELAIVASGNLDERAIAALLEAGAPIDGFGLGSRVALSGEAMDLDTAYKLVEVGGRPVMKLSSGKQSLPGSKQVWRREEEGRFAGDVIALADEPVPAGARPLLACMMRDGVPVEAATLDRARERAARERAALAPPHRLLEAAPYPVEIAPGLAALRDRLAAGLAAPAAARAR